MAETNTKLTIAGADPQQLAEMTAYQEGAVVSRTLIQNDSGTLTVFSFDEGQALSEHTVPFNAFIQVLDGQCRDHNRRQTLPCERWRNCADARWYFS